ncbi:endolysin glycoside hydrolase [Streptomyces phage Sycamore]|uniref:Endolysin glycoside hydrolase n=1 Tax=Streptomyces phage Sycamore TaxID=2767589 RepID=A0A873WDU5_9CAUD|nr:endolysin glycoside hydrolase [Streptomyces phage Sycamore]
MKLVTRAQWGAREPDNGHDVVTSNYGVKVHYLGSPYSVGDHSTCAAYMRKLQNDHMDGNGWADFAYNFGVCEHGYVFEGRGLNAQNAANGNTTLNRNHFAVLAFVGSSGHTSPTADQVQGLKDAIGYLRAHGAGNEIKGHKDGYATACPGGPLYTMVHNGSLEPGTSGGGGGGTTPSRAQVTINGLVYGYDAYGEHVTTVGTALVSKGFGKHYTDGPGPRWTDADTLNYADFQRSLGFTGSDADGVPGPSSLKTLLGYLPGTATVAPAAYEPFPGVKFFQKKPDSKVVTAMGKRLVAEGCSAYASGPGSKWTNADRESFKKWQRKLGDAAAYCDGWPGKRQWDALKVPKVK